MNEFMLKSASCSVYTACLLASHYNLMTSIMPLSLLADCVQVNS